ncbi:hypothetical protein CDL15_Pgr020908 [Punica granatum]|uniref:Uncharacterized protein n=1 Tax=Punica granatum TaxID=22663 RepID=A0A218XVG8_PUNGR|nr:hypothetical protein CDL15_Pgr020908 [Punica granatum]
MSVGKVVSGCYGADLGHLGTSYEQMDVTNGLGSKNRVGRTCFGLRRVVAVQPLAGALAAAGGHWRRCKAAEGSC